jgi:hypothetical protein
MAIDEEKALHVVPSSASPMVSDENARKSISCTIPLSSNTAMPHIQPTTRASIRQVEVITIPTTTSSSSKNKQQSPPPNLLHP